MQPLGNSAMAVIKRAQDAAATTTSPPPQSSAPALPARRNAEGLPVLCDPETDYHIGNAVWSNWIPSNAPRAIVRALTPAERHKLQGRADALTDALRAYGEDDIAKVEAEIAAMLSGFRSMRQEGEAVDNLLAVTRLVLAEFPHWAIAKGCLLIARRQAGLDPRWAPNDTEIHAVVSKVMEGYQQAHRTVTGLLSAPVERPDLPLPQRGPQPTDVVWPDSLAFGRPTPTGHALEPDKPDGKHHERVKADIARRKAARDAQQAHDSAA